MVGWGRVVGSRANVGVAFLLSSNGAAYNIAHASAFVEAVIEWWFLPGLKTHHSLTVLGMLCCLEL